MPDFSQLDREVRAAFRYDFEDVEARGVRRRRGRARRRVAAVACGLAVLVAGGGAVVVASARGAEQGAVGTPSTGPSPVVMPDLTNLKTLAEEWPQAVRRLPDRLPDGSTYRIVKALGGDKYLVHGKQALWVYDLRANSASRLMDEPRAQPAVYVSGEWVIRYTDRAYPKSDITAVRLTGGPQIRVASDVPAGEGPVVVNGDLVWSEFATQSGILWRAPITGGGPVTVYPGSAGWHVGGSVWAARYRSADRSRDGDAQLLQEVWNLRTGERRGFGQQADVQRYDGCSPFWCLAVTKSGKWAVQRLDGTRYTEGSGVGGLLQLQYQTERWIGGHVQLPDRGPTGPEYKGWHGVLWDVESGRAAYGGGAIDADGFWEPRPESGAVPLDNDSLKNVRHDILDLTAL